MTKDEKKKRVTEASTSKSSSLTIVQNASVRLPSELQWSGNMADGWKFVNQNFQIYLKASINKLS